MSPTPPHRGCRLTGQYTPGGPAGPELLGVHAGNSPPQPHDGRGTVPIPVPGHFSDALQLAPSKSSDQSDSPQQLKEPWANRLLLNPQMNFKLSEYSLLKLSRT